MTYLPDRKPLDEKAKAALKKLAALTLEEYGKRTQSPDLYEAEDWRDLFLARDWVSFVLENHGKTESQESVEYFLKKLRRLVVRFKFDLK